MDITETLAPTSDQLDAVDLLGGPRIFTITDVVRNNGEQPLNIHLAEFPRVWRPSKGMRRVLAACWGADASQWSGRRVELFCDPDVIFGKEKVGGTRISRLSHIDGTKRVPLLVSRGKSSMYAVDPLPDAPPARDWVADIAQAATMGDLAALYGASPKTPDIVAAKDARKAELQTVDAELLTEAEQ